MHRHFSQVVEDYAVAWEREPVQAFRVAQRSRFCGQGSGACLVELADRQQAFMKPDPQRHQPLTTIREKVASDLAYILGLPVPPVVIREPCSEWPAHLAVSLVSLEMPRSWGRVGPKFGDEAACTLEALRTFWTWIADTDHDGHHENLLYAIEDGRLKFCAIDHGHSLGHGVTGSALDVPRSAGYGTADIEAAQCAREELVERIQRIGDDQLEQILDRLDAILSRPERMKMVSLLRLRRDGLTDLLKG